MAVVALHNSDKTAFPNLALMKIAAWHKAKGDSVEHFMPLHRALIEQKGFIVYSSKIFSWTSSEKYLPDFTIRGGTGYALPATLPEEMEHICPDYDFYSTDFSLGFLTRGCIRSCSWCVVPAKEGEIRPHADIEEFCRHRNVVLLDNNVLAHDHGIAQIEKMARLSLRVDFNQGLDARLIDPAIARRLAALRWMKPLRLACDHRNQIPAVEKAVHLLRAAGVKPQRFSCYVLVRDIPDALERVEFLRALDVTPFAQPYMGTDGTSATHEQRHFSRWVNVKKLFKSVAWENESRHVASLRPVQIVSSPLAGII